MLPKNGPAEDLLCSFALSFACSAWQSASQGIAVTPARGCCRPLLSLWHRAAVVPQHSTMSSCCASLFLNLLLPRLLPWHETFGSPSSEDRRSKVRVKTWNFQTRPSLPFLSSLPSIQENGLVTLSLAKARESWQSALFVQTSRVMPSDIPLLALWTARCVGKIFSAVFKCTNLGMRRREPWWRQLARKSRKTELGVLDVKTAAEDNRCQCF